MICSTCGGELEHIEFVVAGVVLDSWVQHVDESSLCTPAF